MVLPSFFGFLKEYAAISGGILVNGRMTQDERRAVRLLTQFPFLPAKNMRHSGHHSLNNALVLKKLSPTRHNLSTDLCVVIHKK